MSFYLSCLIGGHSNHSLPVYEIWKKYGSWKNIQTPERSLIKSELIKVGVDKNDTDSVAKRPDLVIFNPEIIKNFKKYLELAIKEGKVEQVISKNTGRRSIVFNFTNAEPVGFKATKVEDKEPKIEETNIFYVSFDIEKIMEKLENMQKWDQKIDGKFTTMCPDI